MTRALSLVALLSLPVAGTACTRADAASKAAPKMHVTAAEAPTYLIAGGKATAQLFVNATTGSNDVAVSIVTFSPGTCLSISYIRLVPSATLASFEFEKSSS